MPLFTPDLELSDDYPTIEPSLRLDFANARALDPRITFERDSSASYVGKDGLIKLARANEPRFDHDPITGESLGLLIEESRTNYQSGNTTSFGVMDIDIIQGVSTVSDVTTAPNGFQQGGRITGSGTDEVQRIGYNTQTTASGQYNIFSVFVKKDSGTPILGFYSNTFVASNVAFNVDLSDGTTNAINAPADFVGKVQPFPNGWYRVSVMGIGSGASGSWNINIVPSLTSARGAQSGSNASASYFIWGVQEELGSSPFASSVMFTQKAGSFTRLNDTAKINNIQFHNPFEFVLYAAGRSNTGASISSGSITDCLVSLGDTTNSYRFMLRKYRYNSGSGINTGFTFRYRNVADSINMDMFPNYYDGQADGYDTTTIAPIWNDSNIHRSAFAFEAGVSTDNIRGCADGTLVVPEVTTPGSYSTVSNPGPYTQATTLQIGSGSSSGLFNGTINEIRYYPKRLTNTQLQTLTQ